jgi:cytochrome P450
MIMVSGEHVKNVLNSSNYYIRWLREEGLKEIGMYEQAIAFNHIVPHWKSQRSFFKNNIGGNFLTCVPQTASKNAKKLVDILHKMQGQPVNIANYMNRLALDNVGELAFGRSFDTLTEDASETAQKINSFMQAWVYFVITPPFVFKYLRPFTTSTHRDSVRALSDQVQDIIRQRRQEIEKNVCFLKKNVDIL